MKKLLKLSFLFMAAASVMVFQSCKDEEDIKPAPSVSVDPTSAANTPGGKVTANLTLDAPNGGKSLVTYVAGAEVDSKDLTSVDLSAAIPYEYTIPASAVIGSKIIIAFQLIDNKDYPSAITNFVVTVGDPVITLQGNLATSTLDATKSYLLKGQVFVPSGVTLTIPEGTVIKGDKATKSALIVQPGGKLIANGSAAKPIVFTSSQAIGERDRGDWAGIILLGNAWVNQTALPSIEGITPSQTYGNITSPSTNATDNSGSLKYVRIEYAGIELTPNNETNGLTLGAVGNGTTLDNIQVSYGGDDGFEWFGGTVNAKHLVSLSTWDDDFDTDFGFQGNVQFALSVRNPFFADQSGSTAFESDNQGNANDTPQGSIGYTQAVFSNVTVFGPRDYNVGTGVTSSAPNGVTRAISGNYTRALHIRRRTAVSILNTVVSGWGASSIPGLTMDDQATLDNYTSGLGVLANNVMFYPDPAFNTQTSLPTNGEYGSTVANAVTTVKAFWEASSTVIKPTTAAGWSPAPGTPSGSIDPYTGTGLDKGLFFAGFLATTYPSNPNFAVSSGTLLTGFTSANLFGSAKVSGAFFDKVTYKGAFATTDWTDGWSEFQPANKAY